jgi:hypothetical protein
MKTNFKVGDEAWGIRERGRDDWALNKIKIDYFENAYTIGNKVIDKKDCTTYEVCFNLLFATENEAQKVFDKIQEQVNIKSWADEKIRKIAYGH